MVVMVVMVMVILVMVILADIDNSSLSTIVQTILLDTFAADTHLRCPPTRLRLRYTKETSHTYKSRMLPCPTLGNIYFFDRAF
jgi:hypothetical protein